MKMSKGNLKTYKIWSDDLGYDEDEAYIRTPEYDFSDVEDAVSELCDEKWSEWEYPTEPLVFSACEVDDKGNKIGDVQKISVGVDYSPNFYTSIVK